MLEGPKIASQHKIPRRRSHKTPLMRAVASALAAAAAFAAGSSAPVGAQAPPHCPLLKIDTPNGPLSLMREWTGVVLSTPQDGGNLTQADVDVGLAYDAGSDVITANVTYSNPVMGKGGSPAKLAPCRATMKVGCLFGHQEDFTFAVEHSDSCFVDSSDSNDWKCKYFLTGDDLQRDVSDLKHDHTLFLGFIQQPMYFLLICSLLLQLCHPFCLNLFQHGFAFALAMRWDTDPSAAPYPLRGSPFGSYFTGCGSSPTQRALEWRLKEK